MTTSFTVTPSADLTAFTSSSGTLQKAKRRCREILALKGVGGAVIPPRERSGASSSACRSPWPKIRATGSGRALATEATNEPMLIPRVSAGTDRIMRIARRPCA